MRVCIEMYGVMCGFPLRGLGGGLVRAPSIAERLSHTQQLAVLHCNGGLI